MKTKNKIELIGFVGRDPETRQTTDGTPVAHFNLATTERWKGKDGQPKEHTEWHRIVFFGPAAKQLADFLRKGSFVEIEGSVRSRTYEKDGATRTAYEIRGTEYWLLDRRPGGGDVSAPNGVEPPLHDGPTDDDIPL
jgi:single-strand DNA-binding protein